MKNISILLFTVLLGFSSCSDALDVAPEGRTSLDEIFSDPVGAAAYLNTCYGFMQQRHLGVESFNSNGLVQWSDDVWDRDDCEGAGVIFAGPLYIGSLSPSTPMFTFDPWQKHGWPGIRACNIFIQRIPGAPVQEGMPDQKAQWIAEAKVLRAYFLLELVMRYGGLPILTEPLDINDDCSGLTRESFKDCVDQVLRDCDEALAEPTLPWRRANKEQFRMTKAIASGIKSRAILFAASPLWCGGQNYWADAERITKKSLDDCLANGYALYTQLRNPSVFQSAFQEYFCTNSDPVDNPIDKETIIESKSASNIRNLHSMPIVNAYKAGFCPTQELVDAFDMQTTGQPVLNPEKPYLDERHLQPNYNPGSGYDPENPYKNRDPRFYATVHFNGDRKINQQNVLTTIETFMGGNCGIAANVRNRTATGYYLKKGLHPQARSGSDQARRLKMMRLAELYLNYAEAANENGNLAGAIQAVNTVRARANMPPIDPKTKEEARLRIRNERRVEMAIEERRHFDVRRWQSPDGDLSATDRWITGMWLVKKPDYATVDDVYYYRFNIWDSYDTKTEEFLGTGRERKTWENRYLIWPVQIDEANRLQGATGVSWQNPGW